MRTIVALLIAVLPVATLSCAAPALAGPQDRQGQGLDAAARARLVGDHLLTLQWLGWGDLSGAGKLVIEDAGDRLPMRGEQHGTGENAGDYVRIEGRIVSATRDGFVFEGEILTRVHHIAGGVECRRAGTFNFKATGKRKYWRLQEMQSPCDSAADYVDVYFRGI